jgi:pantoate--beta-alanine ligase
MGALHEGHASLVTRAKRETAAVGVSIFVNPLQFGSKSDLAAYPRTAMKDLDVLDSLNCDFVFTPSIEEMYPDFPELQKSTVSVAGPALGFEGADRPGHFDGMATVVAKLFFLTGSCSAYFGEKDFQQLAVVRQMVRDLSMPVTVVGCPTIRETDGLALSSRNVRLSQEGRVAAGVLSTALDAGVEAVAAALAPAEVNEIMASVVADEPLATLHYAELVDAASLTGPLSLVDGVAYRLLLACSIDGVRLIDNAHAEVGGI